MPVQHSSEALSELYRNALVWRGTSFKQSNQQHTDSAPFVKTGFTQLDEALKGGWPSAGVVELNCPRLGAGELRLLLPALSNLQEQSSLQAWVNPPAKINAQALLNSDCHLNQAIVVESRSEKDAYWSVDQLLRSGSCSALVFWCRNMTTAQAKRLQVQAKQNGTLVFVMRMSAMRGQSKNIRVQQSLPVSARIQLRSSAQGLLVDIFKLQNTWPVKPFELNMGQQWPLLIKAPSVLKRLNQRFARELKHSMNDELESTGLNTNIVPFPLPKSDDLSSAQSQR